MIIEYFLDVPGKPSKPDAVEVDKDHIKLRWMAPISNGGSQIIGYDVERREVLSGRWIKLTKSPLKVNFHHRVSHRDPV